MCGSWGKGSHLGNRWAPNLQKGERGGSWLQTAQEKGRSNMTTGAGDELATASRGGDAQSECYCALYSDFIV